MGGALGLLPESLRDGVHHLVQGGRSEAQALETVLFREPDCFPGVRAALEAK